MTLDEAIQHCKEVAIEYEAKGECYECGKDHRQLAEWLEDYKRLKEHFDSLPDWLPVLVRCDEAMPKKDGEYLCVSNREWKILPYRNGEFYCTCFDAVLRCCNSSVTNWMPLPDPPKGDAE